MILIELFRFLGVQVSTSIYKGIINESFVSKTLTRKELKKEESFEKGKGKKKKAEKEKEKKIDEKDDESDKTMSFKEEEGERESSNK